MRLNAVYPMKRLLCLIAIFLYPSFAFASDYIEQRLEQEKKAYTNGYVLVPHKKNYILPFSYMHNASAKRDPGRDYKLQHVETKFQISTKILAWPRPVMKDNGYLFISYTGTSVWQSTNRTHSSPFRDINHEPEVFMLFTTPYRQGNFSIPLVNVGFSHQSNGEGMTSGGVNRSRSWNRVYVNTTFSFHNWYFDFKPWLRIPVRKKRHPYDAKGDDNPDISHYYGYFELTVSRGFGKNDISIMLRNNLQKTNRGAIEVNYTRPISPHVKTYVQLFHGYGEMMIDYDKPNTRIGVGFLFGGM